MKVAVIDLTTGSIVSEATIWQGSSSYNNAVYCNTSFDRALSQNLVSGHIYLLRESVGTDVNNLSVLDANADFWNGGRGPKGLDFYSITVRS